MQQRVVPVARILRGGIAAGLAGAVLIDFFLLIATVEIAHATNFDGFYAFVASALVGKAAYTMPSAVGIGIAAHVAVSLGWGIGYAYLAATTPQVRARPLLSGTVYGLLVMTAMQIVEVAANVYSLPTPTSVLIGTIAHVVFFGIPVAYVVRRFESA